MTLKLQTPNRDTMCVVVNPYPVFMIVSGPGPPEQKLAFRPYELDDDDYKCIRLLTEHTAGRMVKRYPRLVKLSESKGWEFSDAMDRIRKEHPDWENKEVFETAWFEVLKNPMPTIEASTADQLIELRYNQRLDEMDIPASVYANPEKPWPSWWKGMVIEDKALAFESWEDYAEGETATIKPEEAAVRAREARDRERARESMEAQESERRAELKSKARRAKAAADRQAEAGRKSEPSPPRSSVLDSLDEALGSSKE